MGSYKEARIKDLAELIEEVRSGEKKLYSSRGEERRIVIYDDLWSIRYDGSALTSSFHQTKTLIPFERFMDTENVEQCAKEIMEEAIVKLREEKVRALHRISESLLKMQTFDTCEQQTGEAMVHNEDNFQKLIRS